MKRLEEINVFERVSIRCKSILATINSEKANNEFIKDDWEKIINELRNECNVLQKFAPIENCYEIGQMYAPIFSAYFFEDEAPEVYSFEDES